MNTITVTGHVGNDPELKRSKSGLAWTQIRVGSTHSWFNAEDGQRVDGPTIWFTVKAWGPKAEKVIDSVRKGTPVIVTGRLEQEPYLVTKTGDDGERITELRNGLLIADAIIGIDLANGAARYFRTCRNPLPDGYIETEAA